MRYSEMCYGTVYLVRVILEEKVSSFFSGNDIIKIINDHTLTRMHDRGDK